MDVNAACEQDLRQHCPQAGIGYDLFHVIVRYGREVVDRMHVYERQSPPYGSLGVKAVQGAHWLPLRNRDNLAVARDQVRLKGLLAANQAL